MRCLSWPASPGSAKSPTGRGQDQRPVIVMVTLRTIGFTAPLGVHRAVKPNETQAAGFVCSGSSAVQRSRPSGGWASLHSRRRACRRRGPLTRLSETRRTFSGHAPPASFGRANDGGLPGAASRLAPRGTAGVLFDDPQPVLRRKLRRSGRSARGPSLEEPTRPSSHEEDTSAMVTVPRVPSRSPTS